MNSLQRAVLIVGIFLFVVLANVSAQTDIPRNGACSYRDTEYRESFFCVPAGESMLNLPEGFNDSIQSVRVFGDAQVTVFNDSRFEGANTRLEPVSLISPTSEAAVSVLIVNER